MRKRDQQKIRYAVVGLGYISQVAALPAFEQAKENSELVALISSDPVKLRTLGRKYKVKHVERYENFEKCLTESQVDAVYIALPNNMHREYAVRAAQAGVHILCEKPMAVTEEECHQMIEAAAQNNVKLMIAYRLHFEEANLKAIEMIGSGKLGQPRFFTSVNSMQVVDEENIRLKSSTGGGPLLDVGIYCLNAARYLFQAEPIEGVAFTSTKSDERFEEVEEMTAALLRFSEDRLAAFTCSFDGADASYYEVIGTKGRLRLDPAFEYVDNLRLSLTINSRTHTKIFSKKNQFAAEFIYFSDCIINNQDPEPSGAEGLADIKIIQALYQSARERRVVSLNIEPPARRPQLDQEIDRPAVRRPKIIHATPPSGE